MQKSLYSSVLFYANLTHPQKLNQITMIIYYLLGTISKLLCKFCLIIFYFCGDWIVSFYSSLYFQIPMLNIYMYPLSSINFCTILQFSQFRRHHLWIIFNFFILMFITYQIKVSFFRLDIYLTIYFVKLTI